MREDTLCSDARGRPLDRSAPSRLLVRSHAHTHCSQSFYNILSDDFPHFNRLRPTQLLCVSRVGVCVRARCPGLYTGSRALFRGRHVTPSLSLHLGVPTIIGID